MLEFFCIYFRGLNLSFVYISFYYTYVLLLYEKRYTVMNGIFKKCLLKFFFCDCNAKYATEIVVCTVKLFPVVVC